MAEISQAMGLAPCSGQRNAGRESTNQDRPFRAKLHGSVPATIRLPNHREVSARLHQLSVSGGLINLEKTLDEKLEVELIFQLGELVIHEKVQMMFPMWATQGWLQPFRFVDMPEVTRCGLEKSLLQLVPGVQENAS